MEKTGYPVIGQVRGNAATSFPIEKSPVTYLPHPVPDGRDHRSIHEFDTVVVANDTKRIFKSVCERGEIIPVVSEFKLGSLKSGYVAYDPFYTRGPSRRIFTNRPPHPEPGGFARARIYSKLGRAIAVLSKSDVHLFHKIPPINIVHYIQQTFPAGQEVFNIIAGKQLEVAVQEMETPFKIEFKPSKVADLVCIGKEIFCTP
jgi:hypothetical protein